MKSKLIAVPIIFAILPIFAISGCTEPNGSENTKIGEIISNPNLYIGKIVIIDGKYGGWSGNISCDSSEIAMKTRSDSLIYDDTGCLYMGGSLDVIYTEKELDPLNNSNVGGRLTIRAVVSSIEGKPILGEFK